MTLSEFLLARIESEEKVARKREAEWEARGMTERMWRMSPDSPRRMLAECEAKRRIVGERARSYELALPSSDNEDWHMGHASGLYDAMRLLALPYADHPDYYIGWKP